MTQAAHDAEEALDAPADRRPSQPITFTVDGEPVQTTEHQLTPNQILGLAGIDPASHYLVQVMGRHQTSYQGQGRGADHRAPARGVRVGVDRPDP